MSLWAGCEAPEAPGRPITWSQLWGCLGHKANGRLLLTHIGDRQRELTSGRTQHPRPGRPWCPPAPLAVAGRAAAGAAGDSQTAHAASSGTSSSSLSSSLAAVSSMMQDLHRTLQDPAFHDVPVPTVYLGKLAAPIPAGR